MEKIMDAGLEHLQALKQRDRAQTKVAQTSATLERAFESKDLAPNIIHLAQHPRRLQRLRELCARGKGPATPLDRKMAKDLLDAVLVEGATSSPGPRAAEYLTHFN